MRVMTSVDIRQQSEVDHSRLRGRALIPTIRPQAVILD